MSSVSFEKLKMWTDGCPFKVKPWRFLLKFLPNIFLYQGLIVVIPSEGLMILICLWTAYDEDWSKMVDFTFVSWIPSGYKFLIYSLSNNQCEYSCQQMFSEFLTYVLVWSNSQVSHFILDEFQGHPSGWFEKDCSYMPECILSPYHNYYLSARFLNWTENVNLSEAIRLEGDLKCEGSSSFLKRGV